jgi:hypothetical protein
VVYLKGETETFDDEGVGYICYRRSSNWGQTFDAAETCLANDANPASLERSDLGSASAGYDPLSDTFLIAWRSDFDRIEVHIFSPDPAETWWGRTTLTNTTITMPTIACSPTSYLGYPNCRLAYGAFDDYHCLQWVEFKAYRPFWYWSAYIAAGATYTQCYPQFDPPHIVWSNGDLKFHLAFGQYGAYINHYTMNATGTTWSYHSTVQAGSYPDDFVSGPALSSEEFCLFGCSYNLRAFWLDPPD